MPALHNRGPNTSRCCILPRTVHYPSHGYPADRVGVRRDDVVGADVDGVRDAASLGGGAVLGRAGGG